jgi:hypothetical protein
MEFAKNANNVCHDCGTEIKINGESIDNGVYLSYDNTGTKINVFKCNDCYAKNPALINYQPCEVYSRVVGYIRPVQQWHKGKKQEYGERVEFTIPKPDCGC